MIGHDDKKDKYNGVEGPLYPEPQPHKKIVYTDEDFEDIKRKAPPREDAEADEKPEDRKAFKEKIKE